MEITERRTADVVTLSLSGELDTTTAKAFEAAVLGRIESGDRRFIKEPVRDVFDVAGFSTLFPVHQSHEEALQKV